MQAGDGAAAEAVLAGLPAALHGHPDALMLAALAARARGDLPAARARFEAALGAAPGHPGIWNSYANLLGDLGDAAAAITAYRRALALTPDAVATWINLGLAAIQIEDWPEAETALRRALALAPAEPRALASLGLVEQGQGDMPAAAAAYAAALAVNPGDTRSRHNLGAALRALDRHDEALAALQGLTAAQSRLLAGDIFADTGRFEAGIAEFAAVLAGDPANIPALEALSELLPQLGQTAQALSGYHHVLKADAPRELWVSALKAAKSVKDAGRLRAWADAAETGFGEHPDWVMARLAAMLLAGDRHAALAAAIAADRRFPTIGGIANYCGFLLLQSGDARAAEPYAIKAATLGGDDQSPWSLLTLIWRLLGDPREQWLADYDRLLIVETIEPPKGWRDLASFLGDLAAVLARRHVMLQAPAEQSLRGGTQTRGGLFDTVDPVLLGLQSSLIASVEHSLRRLPTDPRQPFLRRNNGRVSMAGSWSVRLRSEGFHISHIHQQGWLSSAFYVEVPAEIGANDLAGTLQFGVPDAALGLDLTPRRIIVPEPGRLAVFPSYFWHGTAPFESRTARLTVAFDMQPR